MSDRMAMHQRSASHNLCEDGARMCRKRKADAREIFDPGTFDIKESGGKPTEMAAVGLPDRNSGRSAAAAPLTRISAEKTKPGQAGDAPNPSVSFRDVDGAKSVVEHDLQYEKLLRKSKIWGKLFPFRNDDVSTDPEGIKKSAKRPRFFQPFLTYAIAKDRGLRSAIFLKIRSLWLYLLFMFFLIYAACGNFSTETYYFTEAVSAVLLTNCIYRNDAGQANNFEGLGTQTDLKCFIEDCFKRGLAKGLWGKVREDNAVVMLTIPRFRQVRVKNQTCLLSLYRDIVCHDFFSEANESREGFGPGTSPGFVYRRSEDGNVWFRGYYTSYNSDGYSFLISESQDEAYLLSQGWVDDATAAVFIDFTLYSADSNLFCIVQFLFEFPPTGRIKASYTSRAVFLMRYHTQLGHFLFFGEIMLAFLNFINSAKIVINLVYFKHRFFLSIGLVYNLVTTVLCWYAICCLTVRYFAVDTFFNTRFGREFVDFQPILREHVHADTMIVLACFFASFRLYGFLTFDLMEHLKITLRTCFKNIAVFAITFTVIVWAFVQVAHLLFGHSLERYRTFSRSFSELMKVMLGDLDYEGPDSILFVLGPIFILIYVIFVVFVFMSMFFAIINGTFTFVANNIETEEESYFGFLAHCWRIVRRRGRPRPLKAEERKLTNSERIRNLLLQSGYSNMEIRIFFCRYVVDDDQVLDESVLENMWNYRIPVERFEELKVLVEELGESVDVLLAKADWLAHRLRRLRFAKETQTRSLLGRENK